MMEQFMWTEKWRPRTVDDCILPATLKNTAKSFVAQGDLPHILLSGPPGTGKTTIALALCRELDILPLIINGSEERGIDILRTKIMDFAAAISFDNKRRCIIIDEADYLTPDAQAGLRGVMEAFAVNCSFVLTCNYPNKIIPAIHSRCTGLSVAVPADERKKLMLKAANRLMHILSQEQIRADEDIVIQMVKRWWPDMRRMLNEMQRACVDGVLTPSALGQHGDIQFDPLFKAIKTRNYKDARMWIGSYPDIDAPKFYRTVFEWLHEHVEEHCLPSLIVLTADYQYRSNFALDPMVHLSAFVLEIMHTGVFK